MKTRKVHVKNMLSVDTFNPKKPICGRCGKPMTPAFDPIAKKITGYIWECKCSPKTLLSIG